jgi:hypothetical protein
MSGRVTGWDNIGAALRAFDGPEWRIKHATDHGRRADMVVSVVGLQYADGHAELEIAELEIIIDCPDTPIITPAQARKLARALIAAADSAEECLARHTRPIGGGSAPCGSGAGRAAAVDRRGGCAAG